MDPNWAQFKKKPDSDLNKHTRRPRKEITQGTYFPSLFLCYLKVHFGSARGNNHWAPYIFISRRLGITFSLFGWASIRTIRLKTHSNLNSPITTSKKQIGGQRFLFLRIQVIENS